VFVAEEGGTILGFAVMSVIHLVQGDQPLCRLTAIAVAHGARGRGVGRSLVENVEEHARGLGCERLEVTSGHQREGAHAFYERLGFQERPHRYLKAVP
jgi:GNAT superfamily N-acetyltransferase